MPAAEPGALDSTPPWAADLVGAAATSGEDVDAALALALQCGRLLPLPGGGDTVGRWAVLAALARVNLTVARVVEAHTDALAILAEAGTQSPPEQCWGVFAAEDPAQRLEVTRATDATESEAPDAPQPTVTLTGTKPWCSLGGELDAALVTAGDGSERGLFRVNLRDPSVRAQPASGWVARGLRTVVSVPVEFDATPAQPVGAARWYLTRPGFAWGGIGVAACWYGGASAVAAAVLARAAKHRDELSALHAGQADVALHAARTALLDAARDIDAGGVDDPELLALRTRSVVADSVERILQIAGHALGPAALAFDEQHAARVADLGLYVGQHHGERDLAALGARLAERSA